MMMRIHTDKRRSPRMGTLRRAVRAIGALLARVPLPVARPEQLWFPPF